MKKTEDTHIIECLSAFEPLWTFRKSSNPISARRAQQQKTPNMEVNSTFTKVISRTCVLCLFRCL